MTGDPAMEPVEGVSTLDDAADALLDAEDGGERDAQPTERDEPEEEQEEAEEEEADDPTIKLKHDGTEIELPLSKVKELAQQGFDYSKKTMALAEERKVAAAAREQADHLRQQHEQALQQSVSQLQAVAQFMEAQLGEPPSTDLLQYDTSAYLLQERQWQARKGQLDQVHAAIQQQQEEAHRQRQAWILQQAGETEGYLRNTLPGWSDDTLDQLAEYAGKHGLNPQSVDVAFVQKGFWEVLHKAKAYEAIQAKKAEMKPKQTLAKVAKPSAVNQSAKASERMKREEAFRKSPSVDSLAEFLR